MSNNTKTSKVVKSKDPNIQQTTKVLEVGKFYLIHDGSKTGHPGYLIWKDDNANLYLAIKFGTSLNKENTLFEYPLEKNIIHTYLYKRLFLGKRKDFGCKELNRLAIKQNDVQKILRQMDFFNPVYSKNIKRRNKHLYRLAIKKSLIGLRGPMYQ